MNMLARIAVDAARGLGLALGAAALAAALAFGGFGKAYYLGALLPLALVLFLLVAWLLYLGRGGFMRSGRAGDGGGRPEEEESGRDRLSAAAPMASPNAPPGAELFAPRDGGVLPRSGPAAPRRSEEDRARSSASASRALAWGAAWLALLALLLYRLAGIGAAYFL